ncbi:hypothetical protein ACFV4K_34880 [Nocardia sp. NPDC059764]|uniref:hypothetical protein n=1 Tax=Nocardia sp. NPDC059764 TaxID=3346939 RepID=UPI003650820B
MIVSIISIMLMASHRLAGRRDELWLERFEQNELDVGTWGAHGTAFARQQDIGDLDAGLVGKLIPMRQMFNVWVVGLACFGIAAVFMILRALTNLSG